MNDLEMGAALHQIGVAHSAQFGNNPSADLMMAAAKRLVDIHDTKTPSASKTFKVSQKKEV